MLVGLIYLAASVAILLLLPGDVAAKSQRAVRRPRARYWGAAAGRWCVVFAVISCLGALNGWVLIVGEVPLALAERGVLPAIVRHGEPDRACRSPR